MIFDAQRRIIVLEMADLVAEREACYHQYRSTTDDGQRVRLKRKLDHLDKKIDDLERQLLGKDLTTEDTNRRTLALQNKLSKIDFKEQVEIVQDIFAEFTEYGAALFFINDYLKMAGDLFCLELKEILDEETTDLQYYPIEFSIEKTLDEVAFLESLGDYVGLSKIEKTEDYLKKIVGKFLGLIESGSIILIELKKIDLFDDREQFLSWLVNDFWQKLTKKLPLICKSKDIDEVKFIIVINSDDDIFEECSSQPFFCQNQCFNMSKIFAIFLKNWTENEIQVWLKKYPGLRKNKSIQIAKSVYKSSNGGIPSLVRNALTSKLS